MDTHVYDVSVYRPDRMYTGMDRTIDQEVMEVKGLSDSIPTEWYDVSTYGSGCRSDHRKGGGTSVDVSKGRSTRVRTDTRGFGPDCRSGCHW